MENVGYILMDRLKVLDGEGNEEEVLSLNIRGMRFGVRTSEMEESPGGRGPGTGGEAPEELEVLPGRGGRGCGGLPFRKGGEHRALRDREVHHLPSGAPLGSLRREPLCHGGRGTRRADPAPAQAGPGHLPAPDPGRLQHPDLIPSILHRTPEEQLFLPPVVEKVPVHVTLAERDVFTYNLACNPGSRKEARARTEEILATPRVPNTPSRQRGDAGSFWEDRGDRHHAGYGSLCTGRDARSYPSKTARFSPPGSSPPRSLFPTGTGHTRSPSPIPPGSSAGMQNSGMSPLRKVAEVDGGGIIGHVGEVLNLSLIGAGSPAYIRELKERGRPNMLHLEVFTSAPRTGSQITWAGTGSPPRSRPISSTLPGSSGMPSDRPAPGHV